MTVHCYPVARKLKALTICQAFAAGCGGRVVTDGVYRGGPSFFYGVNDSNIKIWQAALRDQSHPYYYSDNSYFDATRQTYFRICKNRLQHSGHGSSDGGRLQKVGLTISPWREGGDHVILVQQSDSFMDLFGGGAKWYEQTQRDLAGLTKRPIRLRPWNPNKGELTGPFAADLVNAHGVVCWSSAAAVNAVLAGVPIVAMGQCAAEPFSESLLKVDDLPHPDLDRHNWAGVLADNQWTLEEIRKGMAWEWLNR